MPTFDAVDFNKDEKEILEDLEEKLNFKVTVVEHSIDRETLAAAIAMIKREFDLINSGLSDLVPNAIQVEERTPSVVALKQLELDPWPKRLETFLKIARQDFGYVTERKFTEWTSNIFGEVKEGSEVLRKETKVQKRKPFDETLHGFLFDALTLSGGTISVQANDRLRVVATKLAGVIQAESKIATLANMKKLQDALIATFDAYDKKLEAMQALINDKKISEQLKL